MADDQNQDNTNQDDTNVTSITVGGAEDEVGVLLNGNDIADLGGGDDYVVNLAGVNIIDAGSGDDTSINITNTPNVWDVVMGGSGNDYIVGPRNGFLDARGGTGNDTIFGGNNTDYLFGDEGNDFLIGGGGDDILVGGSGDDFLLGGSGADKFVFGANDGNDLIVDFAKEDTIDLTNLGGTITFDQILASTTTRSDGWGVTIDLSQWGGGQITLFRVEISSLTADMFNLPTGNSAGDSSGVFENPEVEGLYLGTSGDDTIDLSTSTDNLLVKGGEGSDTITGGSGNDTLIGGEGVDTLLGGAGDDILMGGEGDDIMAGEAGEDWFIGGEGDDTMTGGADADTFIFGEAHGSDTITDFTVDVDEINLSLINSITDFSQLNLIQDGTDTVIDLSGHGGGKITLEDVSLSDLDADDFAFYVPPADTEVDAV